MSKSIFIAEKPSVADAFAKALKLNTKSHEGYRESENTIITWCYGHLVTMSYPDAYDEKLKKWRSDTLPFLPQEFLYEVIPSGAKQFEIVSRLLNRADVDTIYVCTDSGREGEYIYRLVDQMAGHPDKIKKRVWIDSQTEDEIIRGIKQARPLSDYDHLSDAAYLRAKEDYLMGINFSRILTLTYGNRISAVTHAKYTVISVGRVMTCVLGMVVKREREIRNFVKTPFYRVLATFEKDGQTIEGEWKVSEASKYFGTNMLYKENGFKEKADALALIDHLRSLPQQAIVSSKQTKTEKKNPPLLFNLAELQNECSKRFKISPDETLAAVQTLYERKLLTYPRTDARVLSSAIAKEIGRNLQGLSGYAPLGSYVNEVLATDTWKHLEKSRYVNDKQITDHYAIIPTGQGLGALGSLPERLRKIYDLVARRFLGIFYPAAEYKKYTIVSEMDHESFTTSVRVLVKSGYLLPYGEARQEADKEKLAQILSTLKKGDILLLKDFELKEGETSPPKRYNSGSIILAMENAGQLIEDEQLREQIKGAGIGTSATRAEILKKLVQNRYIALNQKTQILSATHLGEMIADTVAVSIRPLLNPELTASWEKGLSYVADGTLSSQEYMEKLESFISSRTQYVKTHHYERELYAAYLESGQYYSKKK